MDSSRNGDKGNGSSNGNDAVPAAAPAKKTSSRVKNIVNYDEKRHLADLEDDIQNGVAHTNLSELEERVNDLGESWETESLFEDVIGDLAEDRFFTDGEDTPFWLVTTYLGRRG